MTFQKQQVEVNTVNSSINVPHWGITLRTLFGAALAAWPEASPGERRDFTVHYKDKEIGTIHVQKHLNQTI